MWYSLGVLSSRQQTFWFHKSLGNCWLAERLLASQKGLRFGGVKAKWCGSVEPFLYVFVMCGQESFTLRNNLEIVDETNQTVVRPLEAIAVHVQSITPVSLRRVWWDSSTVGHRTLTLIAAEDAKLHRIPARVLTAALRCHKLWLASRHQWSLGTRAL